MNQKNIKLLVLSEKLYRSQKLLKEPTVSYYHTLRNHYGKQFLKEELVYNEMIPEEVLQNQRLMDVILDKILEQKDQSNYCLTIQDYTLLFTSPNITRQVTFDKNLIHIEITNHELTSSTYKPKEISTIRFLTNDTVLFNYLEKDRSDEKEVITNQSIQQFQISDLKRTGAAYQKKKKACS